MQICTNLHLMQSRKVNGRKIRALRRAAKITTNELVEILDAREGVKRHPDTIRNIELGHAQPSGELLQAIAKVLGVQPDDLLRGRKTRASAS